MDYYKDEIIPIIGIDLYMLNNGNVDFPTSFGNWFCEMGDDENYKQFARRSCEMAIGYINNNQDANLLYDIIGMEVAGDDS